MDITSQHPWCQLLLTPLTPEQTAQPVASNDPQWEYIDDQMIKLGSLAHSAINIEDIQKQALALLSQKSKDFRIMVHLLRTLQHAGEPDELILAMALLADYVQHFWGTAWPKNPLQKRRFAQQILKRFASASQSFSQKASDEQRENVQGALAHLAQVWHEPEAELAKEVDELRNSYARKPNRVVETTPTPAPSSSAETSGVSATLLAASELTIDNSTDKAWRQTLLKMADLLCELHPDVPIGFCLRRHAIWRGLTAPPIAENDGRTPLAAVSADRTADYLAQMANADLPLWREVEQSLTLAPYWFDGHALSAQIANKLGYSAVAEAIRDELNAFLLRVPALKTLLFSDMTPFLAPGTAAWLQQENGSRGGGALLNQDEIWQCYQESGLEVALQMINQQQQQPDPRNHFYTQLLSAQLLERAGLTALAQQQYQHLLQVGQQVQLTQWEPTLMTLLTEKQRQLAS